MIAGLVAACLAGCASLPQKQLSTAGITALRNQTVIVSVYDRPSFAAMTPAKMGLIGGLLGGALTISAGNSLVKENNVADPASQIAFKLTQVMSNRYGAYAKPKFLRFDSESVDEIAHKAKPSARYVMDVRTVNWGFIYFPTNWTHYQVIYTAKARLIDTQLNAVLAEGGCHYMPPDDTGAPTYDEMVDNGAARLKWELGTATASCVQTLQRQMLAV
ncbi:hypothetical protein [Paludibacterium purpuratum]|nr:hypothetical protein [Paludibacterium purpuratum]